MPLRANFFGPLLVRAGTGGVLDRERMGRMDLGRSRRLEDPPRSDGALGDATIVAVGDLVIDLRAAVATDLDPAPGLVARQDRNERDVRKTADELAMLRGRQPGEGRSAGAGMDRDSLEDRTVAAVPVGELAAVAGLGRAFPDADVFVEEAPRRDPGMQP